MKFRLNRTIVLGGLLIMASSCTQGGGRTVVKTPIIVGDGSIHIRSEAAPFVNTHWDITDKNWERIGKGKDGTFGKLILVGYNKGDLGNCKELGEIFDFGNYAGDPKLHKYHAVVSLSNAAGTVLETITIHNRDSLKGMQIKPDKHLTADFTPMDGSKVELMNGQDLHLLQIDVMIKEKDHAVKTLGKAEIDNMCPRSKYAGCGVMLNYEYPEKTP